MKKSIATGLIGLTALASGAAFAPGLASAQEDAPEAVEQVEGTEEGREGRRGHRGHHGQRDTTVLQDVLGVSEDELMAARQDGQSIADIAAVNGVALDTVIDALVDQVTARINEKVADGTIDQDRADEKLAMVEDKITNKVNGIRPERA